MWWFYSSSAQFVSTWHGRHVWTLKFDTRNELSHIGLHSKNEKKTTLSLTASKCEGRETKERKTEGEDKKKEREKNAKANGEKKKKSKPEEFGREERDDKGLLC